MERLIRQIEAWKKETGHEVYIQKETAIQKDSYAMRGLLDIDTFHWEDLGHPQEHLFQQAHCRRKSRRMARHPASVQRLTAPCRTSDRRFCILTTWFWNNGLFEFACAWYSPLQFRWQIWNFGLPFWHFCEAKIKFHSRILRGECAIFGRNGILVCLFGKMEIDLCPAFEPVFIGFSVVLHAALGQIDFPFLRNFTLRYYMKGRSKNSKGAHPKSRKFKGEKQRNESR